MTPSWHDNDNGVREDALQAYVDGALDGRRRAAIEAYLATNPNEAARLAAYRAQNIGLHALFDSAGRDDEPPLPPRIAALAGLLDAELRDAAEDETPRRLGVLRAPRAWAASVALLLAAGGAGWIALEQVGWRDDPLVAFTRQATQAPLQLASNPAPGEPGPQSPQSGEAAAGPPQVVAWLAAQPGKPPARLPDLEALGFELLAQRMITTAGGQPAAQLLYQDDGGQRVTLYMRAGGKAGQTSFTFTRDGEASQFFWQDSHMAYSLIGKMSQDKLLRIAEAVSESLGAQPDAPAEAATPLEAVQSPGETSGAPLGEGAQEPEPSLPLPLPLPEGAESAKET